MSFTDQKPFVVTAELRKAPWRGYSDGRAFRCYLCGYPFVEGDTARWVFSPQKWGNFFTCQDCDGPDVLDRWVRTNEDLERRCWWMHDEIRPLPRRTKAPEAKEETHG